MNNKKREETNECDSDKATLIVAWAGKLLKCCPKHARHLTSIGTVMGASVGSEPIITEEKCYKNK